MHPWLPHQTILPCLAEMSSLFRLDSSSSSSDDDDELILSALHIAHTQYEGTSAPRRGGSVVGRQLFSELGGVDAPGLALEVVFCFLFAHASFHFSSYHKTFQQCSKPNALPSSFLNTSQVFSTCTTYICVNGHTGNIYLVVRKAK